MPMEEGLQVVNFAHCLHVVLVIGKHSYIFKEGFSNRGEGRGEGYVGGSFHGGKIIFQHSTPDFPALFKKR